MAFSTLCLSRLFHGFSCKSQHPVLLTRHFWNNRALLGAFTIGALLLGLVLGLVTGAFDCWLLALLLWFAASITTGQIDWLTTGVLQRSGGYSLFGAFNPFLLHY